MKIKGFILDRGKRIDFVNRAFVVDGLNSYKVCKVVGCFEFAELGSDFCYKHLSLRNRNFWNTIK